ncbi:6186_t:CDS:2 [Gigaspora margarita]|uniref:6186_t:CDS:1 n=1 Tax=Gigaspora margarita TaxID=4874 RepID=A0ABN7UFI1_GIGMA|nr:6186_t:CDS:2 [Gigaspora margarita]
MCGMNHKNFLLNMIAKECYQIKGLNEEAEDQIKEWRTEQRSRELNKGAEDKIKKQSLSAATLPPAITSKPRPTQQLY